MQATTNDSKLEIVFIKITILANETDACWEEEVIQKKVHRCNKPPNPHPSPNRNRAILIDIAGFRAPGQGTIMLENYFDGSAVMVN